MPFKQVDGGLEIDKKHLATPPKEEREDWEEIDAVLNKFFPPEIDVLTLDGDSRGMKERLKDAITSFLSSQRAKERSEIVGMVEGMKQKAKMQRESMSAEELALMEKIFPGWQSHNWGEYVTLASLLSALNSRE